MRVNVYAEEITDRVQIISKEIEGQQFTGLRFYLELPVTMYQDGKREQVRGAFMHGPGDDDSSAVTFWGKQDLREVLRYALHLLDLHYTGFQLDQKVKFTVEDTDENGVTEKVETYEGVIIEVDEDDEKYPYHVQVADGENEFDVWVSADQLEVVKQHEEESE